MNNEHFRLTTLAQVLEIATTLRGYWFRGHSECFNSLLPRVFRPGAFTHENVARAEKSVFHVFSKEASAFLAPSSIPTRDSDWLMLMQHHGAPTRLLDWTANVMVAVYFAVERNSDKDAELWAMLPDALNHHCTGHLGLPPLTSPHFRFLVAEIFTESLAQIENLVHQCGLFSNLVNPLAFEPPHRFLRMVAQSSRFTIHPRENSRRDISQIGLDANVLVKYVIPATAKERLLDDLFAIGISRKTLFMDLDSMGATVADEYCRNRRRAQLSPPFWH